MAQTLDKPDYWLEMYGLAESTVQHKWSPELAEDLSFYLDCRNVLANVPEVQDDLRAVDDAFACALARAQPQWRVTAQQCARRFGFAFAPWWVSVYNSMKMRRGEPARVQDLAATLDMWLETEGGHSISGIIAATRLARVVRGLRQGIRTCAAIVLDKPFADAKQSRWASVRPYADITVPALLPGSMRLGVGFPREGNAPNSVTVSAADLFVEGVATAAPDADADVLAPVISSEQYREAVFDAIQSLSSALPEEATGLKFEPVAPELSFEETVLPARKKPSQRPKKERPTWRQIEITGEVRAFDYDEGWLRVRQPNGAEVKCHFDPETMFARPEKLRQYMFRHVHVSGHTNDPPGPPRSLHIIDIDEKR